MRKYGHIEVTNMNLQKTQSRNQAMFKLSNLLNYYSKTIWKHEIIEVFNQKTINYLLKQLWRFMLESC